MNTGMKNSAPPIIEAKRPVFASLSPEASDFCKQIMTVSTSFLGGTLLFIDKVVTAPMPWTKWLLLFGYIMFIGAILLVCVVRFSNVLTLEALNSNRPRDFEFAKKRNKEVIQAMRISACFLIFGVMAIVTFVHLNTFLQ